MKLKRVFVHIWNGHYDVHNVKKKTKPNQTKQNKKNCELLTKKNMAGEHEAKKQLGSFNWLIPSYIYF